MVLVDDFSTNNPFVALEISLGKGPTVELTYVLYNCKERDYAYGTRCGFYGRFCYELLICSNGKCKIITNSRKICFFFSFPRK